MMHHHRCNGSCHGTMVGGPCSCGPLFYGHQNNSFSMLFSMPNNGYQYQSSSSYGDEADHMYSFDSSSSPSSSSVDCTLSLGTPSTRLSTNEKSNRRSSNSCMSNFCWDILQSKHSSSSSHHKSSRGSGSGGSSNNNSGGETLLSRRCANCDTTSTPLWRNGPKGPKSLCNACGIRFKKEERRASAAAAAAAANNGVPAGAGVDGQHMLNSSWVHHQQHSSYDDGDDSDTSGIPYHSWRLNVTDRPAGLVHEFTR